MLFSEISEILEDPKNIINIKKIADFWDICQCLQTEEGLETDEKWIFRAQKEDKDNKKKKNFILRTKLEKSLNAFCIDLKDAPRIEEGLLRKFQRHSALYLKSIPQHYDYMEWFALMQHYGAPTRLQDWTYSFFVAVYLAINDMKDNAEVWAINTKYIEEKARKIIMKKNVFKNKSKKRIQDFIKNDACAFIPGIFEDIFMKEPVPFVLPMNPHNLNERLIIQQGTFLCHGDITKPFLSNLEACFSEPTEPNLVDNNLVNKNLRRFKIDNNNNLKKKLLMNLQRMNMNNATLFPGLSGFSESLRTLLAFPPPTEDGGMLAPPSQFIKKYLSRIKKVKL